MNDVLTVTALISRTVDTKELENCKNSLLLRANHNVLIRPGELAAISTGVKLIYRDNHRLLITPVSSNHTIILSYTHKKEFIFYCYNQGPIAYQVKQNQPLAHVDFVKIEPFKVEVTMWSREYE